MADITQNVIIEFITDTTKLQPAVDQLESIGKIEQGQAAAFKATNTEINKQAAALKNVESVNQEIATSGKVTKKNLSDLAASVKGMSGTFQKEFKAGIVDGLKQAGVSIKQFEKQFGTSLDTVEQSTLTLKSQLRAMVEQLAQLKVQGKDTGAEYLELAQQAGKLKDAIGDANLQVKNFGSDTSTFDGLISLTQGLAGGFAVVQGAAALFGDESEELQKTLLRVNAAMAILQGLQQIQITLQKESAAATLLNTIATKGQAAAMTLFNFVVGSSTGVLKAFRLALAATGVGLLVIGLFELINALKSTDDILEKTNNFLEEQKRLFDENTTAIRRNAAERIAVLEAAGEKESDILLAQEAANIRQQTAIDKQSKALAEQRKEIDKAIAFKKSLRAGIGEETKAWNLLNDAIIKNNEDLDNLQSEQRILQTKANAASKKEQKEEADRIRDEGKKAAEEGKRAAEDKLRREKEARAAGFADFKASVELELLGVEKGSQEELAIKKRFLRAELQQALDNDKLTINQRKLLIHKFFADRRQLEKDFARDRDKVILENINADIQAELQGLELSNEKKLELTETSLRIIAQIEIDAANGNASKIAEINAKLDKAIRDARLASIQETLDQEIAMTELANSGRKRAIERQLGDERTSLKERKGLIDELTGHELDSNFKRIASLNSDREQGLISQKDYNAKYAQLIEQQTQIVEEGEKKKDDARKAADAAEIDRLKQGIQDVASVAEVVRDVFAGLADIQAQQENERLTAQRSQIKELQDAGAITEKEAIKRMKKLDAEEKRIKREQAKRDKEIALFSAVINTARGVAQAIPNPFLIALAIAVGAAQIAIIAARPLPKFAKGKKNSFEGLAQVGEAGSELIESKGKMYVANKPEIVYLGKTDKVYSHKETVQMLSKPQMNTERNGTIVQNNKGIEIDYDKIGQAVGKHVQTNVFVDGVQEQAIRKREFIKYLDNKRNF